MLDYFINTWVLNIKQVIWSLNIARVLMQLCFLLSRNLSSCYFFMNLSWSKPGSTRNPDSTCMWWYALVLGQLQPDCNCFVNKNFDFSVFDRFYGIIAPFGFSLCLWYLGVHISRHLMSEWVYICSLAHGN